MNDFFKYGNLYLLLAALLGGSLWSGGYFLTPKWVFLGMLVAAGIWEVLAAIGQSRPLITRSWGIWIFLFFTIYASASIFWSVSPDSTLVESFLLLGYLSVFYVVRSKLDQDFQKTLTTVSMWLVYVASFIAAWGIVTYIFRITPYTIFLDNIYRAGSTFEYSNALSCFCLMALAPTFALMAAPGQSDRPLLGLAASLQVAVVLLTLSRLGLIIFAVLGLASVAAHWRRGLAPSVVLSLLTGLVAAVITVVIAEAGKEYAGVAAAAAVLAASYAGQMYLASLEPKRGSLPAGLAAAITAAGTAAAYLLVRLSERASSIVTQRYSEGFSLDSLLPHRLDTYSGAVEAFRVRPITGSGLGTFAKVYQQYAIASYTKFAHNIVLQTAVDTGLIGVAIIVVFLGYVLLLSLWRLLFRAQPLIRAYAVAVLVFLAYNVIDWEWYIPALTAWFIMGVACMEGAGAQGVAED